LPDDCKGLSVYASSSRSSVITGCINLNNKVEFEADVVAARAPIRFPLLRPHDVWRIE
jgi:hypothetical protein